MAMSQDLQSAIEEAVYEAKTTYEDANKSPIDHGYAHVGGVDGRTRLADALKQHDDVDVSRDSYHGTTVTIDGINRYLAAQRGAYDAFIKTLQAHGVSGAGDLNLFGHAH
jgi:hypothetical protein